ncbi:MAG TPA: ferredoxin [Mycobacteriales bacterium]|nr:ferredoxin [Mycobacteriales bacterium]
MRVSIDTDRCSGHGRCYVTAPGVFSDDDAGYGQVVGDGSVSDTQLDSVEQAIAACPELAITLERP